MTKLELGEDDVLKMAIPHLMTGIKIDLKKAEAICPGETREVRRSANRIKDIKLAADTFDKACTITAILTVISFWLGWSTGKAVLWTSFVMAVLILVSVIIEYVLYRRLTLKALQLCSSLGPQNGSIK
jgi:hypothetical protein